MSRWSAFWSKLSVRSVTPPKTKSEYIDVAPEPSAESQPRENWLARWRPHSRREQQLSSLQSGFQDMRNLMQSISDHLLLQQEVQSRMVNVLEQLPASMEGLKSVNKAAEQQVEVLGLLKTQMESNVQHDQQMIESMNRFNQTLGIMDETSRTSSRTVTDLIEKSRESDELLRDVIARSERRLLTVVISFLLALILGTGALLYLEWSGGGFRTAPATTHVPMAVPVPSVAIPPPLPEVVVEEEEAPPAPVEEVPLPAENEPM